MKDLTVLEKLKVLLPHWIEHNAEHASEFFRWAENAEQAGYGDVAAGIRRAARLLDEANERLSAALKSLD